MTNIRWGLISGGVAFALAFLTSLLFGSASFATALLRAMVFAVLFFGMGAGSRILIEKFIPELLKSDTKPNTVANVFSVNDVSAEDILPGEDIPSGEDGTPEGSVGSQVNITLDDTTDAFAGGGGSYGAPQSNAAMPDMNVSASDDVGNFSDLIAGTATLAAGKDIDKNPSNSYNSVGSESPPASGSAKNGGQGDFSLDFSAFMGEETAEPDSFMDSFSSFSEDDEPDFFEEKPTSERRHSGNKPEKLEGDFNPKEIAAGLRTVLEKDKKG
jgi:hypothetical protein